MIQSVDRAARILQALAVQPGRHGVSELSQRLGLAKGTVHGLLRTMQAHGLVEQHPDSDKYQLGPQLLQLSYRYLDLNELRSRSFMWADQLAQRAEESVRVGALQGNHVLVVHHTLRPDLSLQILAVGETLPLHATALGKAILSGLPPDLSADLVRDNLVRLTGRTVKTLDALHTEIEETRLRGFALEREEAVLGEAGVAAPIFDRHDHVVGAIGIVGPVERLTRRRAERQVAPMILEASRGISRDLGAYSWNGRQSVRA